jgi:hypothetical protein
MPAPRISLPVLPREDPNEICPTCRALPPEDRRALRERAMVRISGSDNDPER